MALDPVGRTVEVFWSDTAASRPGCYHSTVDGAGAVVTTEEMFIPDGFRPAAQADGQGFVHLAWRAEPEGEWEKAFPMRSIMTLAPNVALFVTPRSTGIETLEGLKGERVVVGVAGAGFEFFVRPLLAAHGVTYDDFSPLYNTQAGAVDLLSDGAAAAAFLGGAVPTASITQVASGRDVLLIPLDPDARETLIEQYPFFRPATIPAGTYPGQDEPYEGLDVGSMHLIVSADQDEELVYNLTRVLYENRERLAEKHPAGRAVNPTNAVRDTGTPFHPGAIRYYREIGIWPEASSEGDAG